MQCRHLLHRTLLGRDLGNLGLEAACLRTGLEGARLEKKDIVLADIDLVGLDGGALGRRPRTAKVDADETSRVGGEVDTTERTGRRKTSRGFFDDVVAAVEAKYVAWRRMRKIARREAQRKGAHHKEWNEDSCEGHTPLRRRRRGSQD